MKDRIRQLADQAGLKSQIMLDESSRNVEVFVTQYDESVPSIDNYKKFAELIVLECISLMQNEMQGEEDISSDWVFDNIVAPTKKHFGIKND